MRRMCTIIKSWCTHPCTLIDCMVKKCNRSSRIESLHSVMNMNEINHLGSNNSNCWHEIMGAFPFQSIPWWNRAFGPYYHNVSNGIDQVWEIFGNGKLTVKSFPCNWRSLNAELGERWPWLNESKQRVSSIKICNYCWASSQLLSEGENECTLTWSFCPKTSTTQ